jgi:hypothetical protein
MSLRALSIFDLRRELGRRERGGQKLLKKRNRVAAALASLDAELSALGVNGAPRRGRPPGSKSKPRGRKPGQKQPKNKQSLSDALASAIRAGAVVSPVEAAKRVKARGYRTSDKTFGHTVAKNLRSHRGFRHKGLGQYERVPG